MKGLTLLILNELRQGVPVSKIVSQYNTISQSAIYKIAKRNNIKLPPPIRLTEEEKRERKKKDNEVQNHKKAEKRLSYSEQERNEIPMPPLPMKAMKSRGLGLFNSAWVFSQGNRLEKPNKKFKTTTKEYKI